MLPGQSHISQADRIRNAIFHGERLCETVYDADIGGLGRATLCKTQVAVHQGTQRSRFIG